MANLGRVQSPRAVCGKYAAAAQKERMLLLKLQRAGKATKKQKKRIKSLKARTSQLRDACYEHSRSGFRGVQASLGALGCDDSLYCHCGGGKGFFTRGREKKTGATGLFGLFGLG